jgi:hypothetical protein
LTPLRTSYLRFDDAEVSRLMQKAAIDARIKAEATMVTVRRAVGLGS